MTVEATNPETEVEEELLPETPETDESDIEGDTASPEPETEEVEHEGQKYKIPKALKPALLMQADYTRKTQEVAEQRRQTEERQKQIDARERLHGEFLTDVGKVQSLNDTIAQYEKVEWANLRASNPADYDLHWFNYQQTKDARDKALTTLNTKVQTRALETQRETAKRFEDARSELQRDIPEWSPELAGKLNQFAIDRGFTAQELSQVTDPRVIKLLHAAYQGSQTKQQTQTKQAATKTAEVAKAAKPLTTVTGNSSAGGIRPTEPASDKLSSEEWLKRRNEQVRKRRG